ncbi:alpha/beta hydrolase [Mesorhizobium sp. CAU 1732]|uniref:alpha/beta fold hydrolase n=1 Tax=Mesorhizobium sp. CAU 1732 TaxID=3140358 RepID=UPI0032608AE3
MNIDWTDGGRVMFRAGGANLEGAMFGLEPRKATTIVMLHEGLGSIDLWRDLPQRIAAATGLGVFAYSRRGYGKSDPVPLPRPIDYMEREAEDVLPEVLAALDPRHAILLGHSDGASIAALYLGAFQDRRIRGLILMAPHFFTEPAGLRAIAEARTAYESGDLRARLAKYHADVDNAFLGWNDAWLNPDFAAWNIENAIDYVRVPVLAIQGEDDQYGTLAQLKALESRLYAPFDAVVLKGCRHASFIDKPAETLDAVTDFVARLERIEDEAVMIR